MNVKIYNMPFLGSSIKVVSASDVLGVIIPPGNDFQKLLDDIGRPVSSSRDLVASYVTKSKNYVNGADYFLGECGDIRYLSLSLAKELCTMSGSDAAKALRRYLVASEIISLSGRTDIDPVALCNDIEAIANLGYVRLPNAIHSRATNSDAMACQHMALVTAFVKDRCKADRYGKITAKQLLGEYCAWHEATIGDTPEINIKAFISLLVHIGFIKRVGAQNKTFIIGLCMK